MSTCHVCLKAFETIQNDEVCERGETVADVRGKEREKQKMAISIMDLSTDCEKTKWNVLSVLEFFFKKRTKTKQN